MVVQKTAPAKAFVEGVGELAGLKDLSEGVSDLAGGHLVAGTARIALALPVGPGEEERAGKIVIGENMSRVRAYAKRIGADVFEPTAKTIKEGFKQNMSFIRRAIHEGKEIIDIGPDPNRAIRSNFYRSEESVIERRGYPVTKDLQP